MKVMLVEDSTPLRGIIKQMLFKLGYEDVAEAGDGQEAWERLSKEKFELLLTDWNMPRMSGLELLQKVRQAPELKGLPVVMLTTRNNKQDIISAVKAGVNNYVTKPCKPSQLKEKIDKAILQQVGKKVDHTEVAEGIIRGCRKYHPTQKGPYILFFEARTDIEELPKGGSRELARFYQCVLEVLEGFNQTYPGLELGYSIEHDTKEVSRLVRAEDQRVEVLMISARTPEGFSLARMISFGKDKKVPVFLICDSIAALSPDQRDGVAKVGIEMLERRAVTTESLKELVERYLVPEVRTTASGLQYLEVLPGPGVEPQAGQQVTVHYTGMLENGTVFDNSIERDQPFEFTLGQEIVIDGWEEGISMMKKGGRALLVIPPELGYGEEGDGKIIPPNATLIFNVELVDVSDPPEGEEKMVE
jgi:peptidylprolyl isomerase